MGGARWRGPGRARAARRADRGRAGAPGGRRHREDQPGGRRHRRGLRRRGRGPAARRPGPAGAVRRRALPDEGPGADAQGPAAGAGLAVHARPPARGRYLADGPNAPRGPEPDGAHHDAGIRRLQLGRKPGRVHHAQPLEPGLHHLRFVGRQRRCGKQLAGIDRHRVRARQVVQDRCADGTHAGVADEQALARVQCLQRGLSGGAE